MGELPSLRWSTTTKRAYCAADMTSPYPASGEHAPLSGLDEFLVHNAPYPVRVMWTPDAQAYERVWFTCQDSGGRAPGRHRPGLLPQPGHGRGLRHREPPGPPHHGAGPPQAGDRPHGHDARALLLRGGRAVPPVAPPARRRRRGGVHRNQRQGRHRIRRRRQRPRRPDRLRHHLARYETSRLPSTGRRHDRGRAGHEPDRRVRRLRAPGGLGRRWTAPATTLGRRHAPRHARPPLGHARRRGRARALHGHAASAQRRVGRVRGHRDLGRPRPLQPRRSAQAQRHAARAPSPHALRTRHPPARWRARSTSSSPTTRSRR